MVKVKMTLCDLPFFLDVHNLPNVKLKFFHCFPGSFPRLRIFKIDVSISFTDLLQAVVKNDNMAD